ncbi:MAG: HAMP domain-containing histidine kinase [Firmicutes bacterium]|nr:HAMP domain-containing histidine kinase [Bacillota bacterium]
MFRNKEIVRFCMLLAVITACSSAAGFFIGRTAGLLCLISAAVFSAAFFLFTRKRYQRIARISQEIDEVLHNEERLLICEAEEGELSILQSEITKMTLRIREQNHTLKNEKEHLADSLADIAHQLRTPLTSVNLILSLLANEPEEQKRKTLLREAEGLLLRMDWLLTSLLKLSRLDAGIIEFQREPLDVRALVNMALQPLLISMELHGVGLRLSIADGIQIEGDSGWLAEALRNILKNCMESAGDGGQIEISCEDTLLYTEIIIHDSGPGFEKEDLPCLFDRFYCGKSGSASGYGIGLALCKTIITRQGGTVSAKNHPQGGAVFAVRFLK